MLLNLAADLGRRKDEEWGAPLGPVSLTHTPSLCCMGKNVRFQCMGLILIWYLPHFLTFLSLPPPLENGDIISSWVGVTASDKKGLNMGQFRLIQRVKESRQTWAQIPSSATSNHVTSRKLMLLSLSSDVTRDKPMPLQVAVRCSWRVTPNVIVCPEYLN